MASHRSVESLSGESRKKETLLLEKITHKNNHTEMRHQMKRKIIY